ncbi:hypothetical protein PSAC2689_110276 [Paraburkholderia sacchari]
MRYQFLSCFIRVYSDTLHLRRESLVQLSLIPVFPVSGGHDASRVAAILFF